VWNKAMAGVSPANPATLATNFSGDNKVALVR
jgi:hypothetical protein